MIDERFSAENFKKARPRSDEAYGLARDLKFAILNEIDDDMRISMLKIINKLNAMGHNLSVRDEWKLGGCCFIELEEELLYKLLVGSSLFIISGYAYSVKSSRFKYYTIHKNDIYDQDREHYEIDERYSSQAFTEKGRNTKEALVLTKQLKCYILYHLGAAVQPAMFRVIEKLNALGHNFAPYAKWYSGVTDFREIIRTNEYYHKFIVGSDIIATVGLS